MSEISASGQAIDHSQLRLAGEVAELRVLLNFLSGQPNGLAQLSSAPSIRHDGNWNPVTVLAESELRNPTLLVQRVFEIGQYSEEPQISENLPADAAFLLRAKGALTERAWPATAVSIAFTSMVNMNLLGNIAHSAINDDPGSAFPALSREAKRFARFIRFLKYSVGILSVLLMSVTAAAVVPFLSLSSGSVDDLRLAIGISTLSAFYALLGAMLSALRNIYRQTAASILTPRQRSRLSTLPGFFVGGVVGLLAISSMNGDKSHTTAILAVPAFAFLAGYFTDPILSVLDRLVDSLAQLQATRERSPRQLNALLSAQTEIADTVTDIHNKFERLQNNVSLDSFDGSLIIRVINSDGTIIPIGEHTLPVTYDGGSEESIQAAAAQLFSGEPYQLSIELSRDSRNATDGVVDPIRTGEGDPPKLVVFSVVLDSPHILFSPRRHEIAIERVSQSGGFSSNFLAPGGLGRHDVFVEISQKSRLVHVALLPILVTGTSV